jgi:DNA modification methylase
MRKLGSYRLNEVHAGNARQFAEGIPPESIDVIFTDPIYDQEQDYLWLAEIAKVVLKPTGLVLIWSNGNWHHRNTRWLENAGLTYRWDFALAISGVSSVGFCGKVVTACNRLVWLDIDRQSKMQHALKDGFISIPIRGKKTNHRWTKDPIFTEKAIKSFMPEGGLLVDFFAGGGTIPAMCKQAGFDFWACEIDPENARQANIRVRETAYKPKFEGFGEAQHSLPPTAFGVGTAAANPLQSNLFADDSPATNGGG